MSDHEIRIAHLYAHFLNIYGDRGNIITLAKRAQWRGIKVEIVPIALDAKLDPDYFDFYFIGGGQDKQQQTIAEDLVKHGPNLKTAVDNGAVILAVCGGYQLLGHYYRPHEGPELRGISLMNAYTIAGNRRMIGNVVVKRADGNTLVGFENHSGKTFLEKGTESLGRAIVGNGNNGDDRMEGAHFKNVYGTYLHGSLLPKNPLFADELLRLSLKRRYGNIKFTPLDDTLERSAHSRATSLPA